MSGQKNSKENGKKSKSRQDKKPNIKQSPLVAELFQVLQRYLKNQQHCDACGHDGALAFAMVSELCVIQDDAPIIVVGILLGEYAKEGGVVVGNKPIAHLNLCGDCIREAINKSRTHQYVELMLDRGD